MKLKRVYIENFKGIKQVEIDFVRDSGLRQLTALLGDNGSGKTTVLQAIAWLLKLVTIAFHKGSDYNWNGVLIERIASQGDTHLALDLAFDPLEVSQTREVCLAWQRNPQSQAIIQLGALPGNFAEVTVEYSNMNGITSPQGLEGISLLYGRDMVKVLGNSDPSIRDKYASLGGVFWFDQFRSNAATMMWHENTTHYASESWSQSVNRLREVLIKWWSYHASKEKEAGYRDYIEELQGHFAKLFPGTRFVGSKPGPGYYATTPLDQWYFLLQSGDRQYDIAEMSSGEQAVLPILFEFVRLDIARSKSIVLIDELELHLHPPQQQALLRALPIIGPDCQYIITTHSDYLSDVIPAENEVILEGGRVHG
jgi:predicted ATPase